MLSKIKKVASESHPTFVKDALLVIFTTHP
jgi:hypothetical protein